MPVVRHYIYSGGVMSYPSPHQGVRKLHQGSLCLIGVWRTRRALRSLVVSYVQKSEKPFAHQHILPFSNVQSKIESIVLWEGEYRFISSWLCQTMYVYMMYVSWASERWLVRHLQEGRERNKNILYPALSCTNLNTTKTVWWIYFTLMVTANNDDKTSYTVNTSTGGKK